MLTLNKFLLLRLAAYGATTAAVFGILLSSKKNLEIRATFMAELRKTQVQVPDTLPEISQASIDLALEMYQIKIPEQTQHPELDPNLADRGITIKRAGHDFFEVFVGPAAFTSWGLLGSTLAHELEIHANQSFLAIFILEKLGFSATAEAERMAYDYELMLADYFGLSAYDRISIAETRDYYYPTPVSSTEFIASRSNNLDSTYINTATSTLNDKGSQSVLGRLAAALILQK